MVYVRPFMLVGETVSGTSGYVELSHTGIGTQSVRILNDGDTTATLQLVERVGTTDYYKSPEFPMLAGSVETFLLPRKVTHMKVVTATGTVFCTTGESA